MEIEQKEIRDFLATCAPLDRLDADVLDRLLAELEITYFRRGEKVLKAGDHNNSLYLIRKGAVEVVSPDGQLIGRFSEGEWFGYRSVLRGGTVTLSVSLLEDSLLYVIPGDIFRSLVKEHPVVAAYFHNRKTERLKAASHSLRGSEYSVLIADRVGDLVHRTPLLVDGATSIRSAAQQMKDAVATAMLVTEGDTLVGIVTDRAFCTKVAATERDVQDKIAGIMTRDPLTIQSDIKVAEALLIMARHNIRHIPVMEGDRVLGLVTATDLIRHHSHNAIYLINEIYRARDLPALIKLSAQLPDVLVSLVNAGLTADDVVHTISSVGDAITRRLLELATDRLGPSPVPFAWIVAGSLARREQALNSDQDNGIILSDEFVPELHDPYFKELATFVCDGLDACGYRYCPGDVMASNPKWRQPASQWQRYFTEWIDTPQPKALMYASIFFDLRDIHGDARLLKKLQREVLEKTRENSIFLAYLAANALHYRPPLGTFRNFVLEKGGAEKKALNMKKRGVMPVIDLARVYALSVGSDALNTLQRLHAACGAGGLSESGMHDLRDAYDLITTVRLKHQAAQIQSGNRVPDNHLPPEQLSSLERRHLKDAFELVRDMQSAMELRYQTGALG
jgi:CBS domain-containing protein